MDNLSGRVGTSSRECDRKVFFILWKAALGEYEDRVGLDEFFLVLLKISEDGEAVGDAEEEDSAEYSDK